jgi:tetratricopeptide (TPR) repeat protein
MSRRRKWLFRLTAATLAPVLFFSLLEIGLRACGYGHPTRFLVKIAGRDALTTNQQFGWQFFPRAIARAPEVCELAARKPQQGYRIFVLGGSAAMGTPQPAFGLARMLEAMLRERYPGVAFEVVNAAMTAVNSHVVLPIARDCCRYEPDLFLIYLGNNEVIGPYGPGTVLTPFSPSLRMIRTGILIKATRIGQLLGAMLRPGTAGGQALPEWKGMEMFGDERLQVAGDDPRLQTVGEQFRANLSDLCAAARGAGAKVILSTVAVNLRDCAPFASRHRDGLDEAERARWEKLYQAGVDLAAQGKHAEAVAQWLLAAAIDDGYAGLHFRMGRSLLATQQAEKARAHFLLACDLDALRFRADTRTNETIRAAASRWASRDVHLVDAERAFAEHPATPHGVPGREWFYEHVHLTPEGNHLLAAAIFAQVVAILPEWIRGRAAGDAAPPALERCCRRLALTAWDRYQMAVDMAAMTSRPPFDRQLDHEGQCALWQSELAQRRAEGTSAAALHDAEQCYLAAIERSPDDLEIRRNFARLLKQCRQYQRAIDEWNWLLERFPRLPKWHIELGLVLQDCGRTDDAMAEFQAAGRLDSALAPAIHHYSGTALLGAQRPAEAEAEFRQAIALDPLMAKAHNGLGVALRRQERRAEATACFRQAIAVDPRLASAHFNLAAALAAGKNLPDAAEQYRLAAQADPGDFETWRRLTGTLSEMGKADEAIREGRRMLQALPASAEAHCCLASLLAGAGLVPKAVAEYEAALRIDPENLMAGHNLGSALESLGRTAEAVVRYRLVLLQHPESQATRHNLQRLIGRP